MGMIKIIVAGILALPALLVLVLTAPIVALLAVPALALLCYQSSENGKTTTANETNNNNSNKNSHVIISGGSSGIGLSIAHDCVQRGFGQVTILARNKAKLEKAQKELEATATATAAATSASSQNNNNHKTSIVSHRSVDVSDAAQLQKTAQELLLPGNDANNNNNKKVYLFCCAGVAYPSKFEDTSAATFAQTVQTNQLGTIYTVQAFLPHMRNMAAVTATAGGGGGGGTIVLTSSIVGQVGVFGYTSYAPAKFALRGFAEALHAELVDQPNLNIQLAFPPDTDTPGYEEENKLKPKVTKLISEQAGLASAKDVAHQMVKEALKPNPAFFVYFSLEGWMLAALTCGMSPVATVGDAVTQVALMSLFRFISLFYLNDWWRIIRLHNTKEEEPTQKDDKSDKSD